MYDTYNSIRILNIAHPKSTLTFHTLNEHICNVNVDFEWAIVSNNVFYMCDVSKKCNIILFVF